MHTTSRLATIGAMVLTALFMRPAAAGAHCDTLDGPVVAAGRTALQSGDIRPVLKWVKPQAEPELRAAFDRTLKVRRGGQDAKALADMYFFETLVRLHRAGEGAPYTGLKPAGTVPAVLTAADNALAGGSPDALMAAVSRDVSAGIRARFERVVEAKKHANDSVDAGRRFVEAYVDYVHYVESLHDAAAPAPAHGGKAPGVHEK